MGIMTSEVIGLPRGRSLTCADLDSMPEDGHRYELIDGTLIVSPAPRMLHQLVCHRLAMLLDEAAPKDLYVLAAPLDVTLASDTVIQPDLLVAPKAAFVDSGLERAPLLAIEVLSPSTRGVDLLLKKERLERAGCPHYWVVDPSREAPSIRAWTLVDNGYIEVAQSVGEEAFAVTDPFNLRVTPARLVEP